MSKRGMLLGMVLAALLIGVATADAQKARPAADKVKFFINTNVGATPLGNLVSTNGLYAKFAELVRAEGFEITHGLLVSITPDFLETIDVLMLPIPALILLDEDKDAIREFIRNGGSLFVLGWYDTGVPWWDFSNMDSLIREFGITFGQSSGGNRLFGSVVDPGPLSDPKDVSAIESTLARKALLVESGKAVKGATLENGQTLIAVSTNKTLLGKGRVIVCGDFSMFAQSDTANYIDASDNTDLAVNIIRYLGGSVDLMVNKIAFNGSSLASFNPANITVRVKNLGTLASGSGKLSIILADSAEVTGAEDIKTLKTLTFSDVAPGKKKKLKTSLSLPAFVGAGTYYLKVVIEYNGDTDPSNNTKVSAPFTVQ